MTSAGNNDFIAGLSGVSESRKHGAQDGTADCKKRVKLAQSCKYGLAFEALIQEGGEDGIAGLLAYSPRQVQLP